MNMFINVIILCIFYSMCDAIFHHNYHQTSAPSHSRIHVCLTPPNTMHKVQKHINDCKHEVNANIFNDAFNLIHEHSFKHPHESHDLHTTDLHDNIDGLDAHNLTLTEEEILKFFEDHDHSGDHVRSIDETLPSAMPSHAPLTIESTFSPPWQQPFPDHFYKKTDSIQSINGDGKSSSNDMQHFESAQKPSVRNPYRYFNIDNGVATKRSDRQRRNFNLLKHLHKDHHVNSDDSSHHDDSIHPTAIDYKDKRIAGCLMHCLYDKDNAIDHHTGYPTLDGLVNFYSDGVHEHGFFMTTLRAVDYCLKGASHKYHINRHIKPNAAVKCDLAFDVFDCVSDRITEYCSKHHFHDSHFDLKEHLLGTLG